MKYLVIGAGGTGGCIGAYMTRGGKDVTLIARGKHLEAIQQNGLTVHRPRGDFSLQVKAMAEGDYQDKADVIFVCVKGYSLESVYPLIRRTAHSDTIVIPVLNIYGTGERMAEKLPGIQVLNGCIYIAAQIEDYGVLKQSGDIFRIVFGRLDGDTSQQRLQAIRGDIEDSEILPILSDNIRRDTLQKFSFVSCMAAAGAYFDANAGAFQHPGVERDTFVACVEEIVALSHAMGVALPSTMVEINLAIMDGLGADASASMQRDLRKGGQSEMDGLILEVIRLGAQYGVSLPTYQKIGEKLTASL